MIPKQVIESRSVSISPPCSARSVSTGFEVPKCRLLVSRVHGLVQGGPKRCKVRKIGSQTHEQIPHAAARRRPSPIFPEVISARQSSARRSGKSEIVIKYTSNDRNGWCRSYCHLPVPNLYRRLGHVGKKGGSCSVIQELGFVIGSKA